MGGSIAKPFEDLGDIINDEIITPIEESTSGLCTDGGATKPKLYSLTEQGIIDLKAGSQQNNYGACVPLGLESIAKSRYDERCKKLYGNGIR